MAFHRYDTKKLRIMLARCGLETVACPIYARHRADFELGEIFAVRKERQADLIPPPRIIPRHTFGLKDAERYHRMCPVI
jgi:hypothetical protein